MDIQLERSDLDKSIEVLSSAAQALQLTRFENYSYYALMLSVDVANVTLAAAIIGIFFLDGILLLEFALWMVCSLSILAGLVSLVLNIPLFVRVYREGVRLKKLGLRSLSRSLWIESRRSRLISRARNYLFIVNGVLLVAAGAALSIEGWTTVEREDRIALFIAASSLALIAALLFAARYLRNQRERIDLTADAEELRNALQSRRQRAGDVEIVTVPSELVEQTAKIEVAQIAKKRKDAVLQSVASPSKKYAVAFDRAAVQQRATLGLADRVELEDLVDELGADAAEQKLQAERGADVAAPLRAVTKSKRVEIDYIIDQATRRIRCTAVRHSVGSFRTLRNGASDA